MLTLLAIALFGLTGMRPAADLLNNPHVSVTPIGKAEAGSEDCWIAPDFTPYRIDREYKAIGPPAENEPAETMPVSLTITRQGSPSWTYKTASANRNSELDTDGNTLIVFEGRTFDIIRALDARSGKLLWEQKGDPPTRVGQFKSAFAKIRDGVVYLWHDGQLSALDARTGQPRWSTKLQGSTSNVWMPRPEIGNGKLYCYLQQDEKKVELFAVDLKSGNIAWHQENGYANTVVYDDWLPGLAFFGGRLYCYHYSNKHYHDLPIQYLTCIDPETGDHFWQRDLPYTGAPFSPIVNDDLVFCQAGLNNVFAFRLSDGKQVAEFKAFFVRKLGPYLVHITNEEELVVRSGKTTEVLSKSKLPNRHLCDLQSVDTDQVVLRQCAPRATVGADYLLYRVQPRTP